MVINTRIFSINFNPWPVDLHFANYFLFIGFLYIIVPCLHSLPLIFLPIVLAFHILFVCAPLFSRWRANNPSLGRFTVTADPRQKSIVTCQIYCIKETVLLMNITNLVTLMKTLSEQLTSISTNLIFG